MTMGQTISFLVRHGESETCREMFVSLVGLSMWKKGRGLGLTTPGYGAWTVNRSVGYPSLLMPSECL